MHGEPGLLVLQPRDHAEVLLNFSLAFACGNSAALNKSAGLLDSLCSPENPELDFSDLSMCHESPPGPSALMTDCATVTVLWLMDSNLIPLARKSSQFAPFIVVIGGLGPD